MRTVKISVALGVLLLSLQGITLFAQSLTVLHAFGTNADGQFPNGGAALSGNILYGSAYHGDNGSGYDSGVIYSVSTNGSNYTILHSFSGPDGQNPTGAPVVSGGMIYGTASQGGANLDGVLYSMSTNGSNFAVLHVFDDGLGGKYPQGGLLLSGSTLFGTTYFDASNGYGAVYSISTTGSNFTVLHSFTNLLQGSQPAWGLALSGSTLYGVTLAGGTNGNQYLTNGYGILYALGTNGSGFNILHEFSPSDGNPSAGSLVVSGNNLYGCTQIGGSNGYGSVFAMGTDGSHYRQLHAFSNSDGSTPNCTLLLSSNSLFGTTETGGNGGSGTVFFINTDGSGYQVMYNFSAAANTAGTNADGTSPAGNLVLSGGYLLGVAYEGGPNSVGTLYQLSLDPPPVTTYPPFFTGQDTLGNDWYYLAATTNNLFGYYSMALFPYVYHQDMGFEYVIDANNASHGAYFYDFTSSTFWYSDPTLFPYLYDFSRNAWVYYLPDSKNPGRYSSNPRWFFDYSANLWTTNMAAQ